MSLEPKHLAPYFPYGLQFLHQDQILMLFNLELPHDQNPMWITGWNNIESTEGESRLISVFPDGCEPIFKPLSDLPDFLEKNKVHDWWKEEWVKHIYDFQDKVDEANIMACPYDLMQKLLQEHFDIFGLIPQGLAKDINTLKK